MAEATKQQCLESLRVEAECVYHSLEEERRKNFDVSLVASTQKLEMLPASAMKCRRMLKGHQGKVLCLDWSSDLRHLATSAQDGRLIVWDAFTTNKEHAFFTSSSWLVACAFSPSSNAVAYGGQDGRVTVCRLDQNNDCKRIINAHKGFTSCCMFRTSEHQVITGGGDGMCILWDVESGTILQKFSGHAGSVMAVDTSPQQPGSVLATGDRGCSVIVWDMRTGKRVHIFKNHEADVNTVRFHPTGDAVVSGSDDASCRIFDLRTDQQIAVFSKENIFFGVNGIDFSHSGRLLFAGYGDNRVNIWDTLRVVRVATLYGHENRISCLRTSPDGTAIATSSWDATIRIWA